jgi:hypothetical protein
VVEVTEDEAEDREETTEEVEIEGVAVEVADVEEGEAGVVERSIKMHGMCKLSTISGGVTSTSQKICFRSIYIVHNACVLDDLTEEAAMQYTPEQALRKCNSNSSILPSHKIGTQKPAASDACYSTS